MLDIYTLDFFARPDTHSIFSPRQGGFNISTFPVTRN